MRISTDPKDPGHKTLAPIIASGGSVRVYLDGKEVRNCVTVDDQTGLVRTIEYDGRNAVYKDERGKVKIIVVHKHWTATT